MNLILIKLENMDEKNIFEIKKRGKSKDTSTYILKVDSNEFLTSSSLEEFLKTKEMRFGVLEFTLEEISRLIERKLSTNYEFIGIYEFNPSKLEK